ncbi:MAG TPA: serine/threonine-protein kinase [Kofleriaceae bacterium]|nr:serine/threonine-protein kinase [Kofleriaceae bacterium]
MDPQQGAPQADLLIGQTIGNYLVTQKLGEGGMGAVYLAEHPTIGKKVALKVLHNEFSNNPEVAERFFNEAKAVNAIDHPNIVQIIDYGVIHGPAGIDRMVYFFMEYLGGVTLSQVIRTEAPMPPERALTIALQVADALAASHRMGIVHRDLKPDNIMLVTRGRERDFVKLLDFGIAKLTGEGMGSHRTRTGLVLGTPAYMSPEQCEGKPNVDHRTDIYALGIVLYEMLVGRVPFIGEGYGEILVQHLTQRPIEPSRYRMMSPHVEQVVLKALEKRPELRYPTMDEMMRAMADPVGYVEAHGGIGGFLQRQLTPSSAPLPPVRLTPAQLTPMPGLMSPVPGTLTSPVPTTLGAASGQVAGSGRSRTGFFIAGAIVLVAAAAGIFIVVHGDKKLDDPGTGSVASGSTVDQGSQVVVDPGSGSQSVAIGSGSGSSGAIGSGSGSQMVETGSGSGSDAVPTVKTMQLVVTSTPSGADVIIDGKVVGKTDLALTVPIDHKTQDIRLRLKGYDDFVIKDVPFEGDVKRSVALVVHRAPIPPPHGDGHGSAHGPGHGSGHGSAHPGQGSGNDSNLMSPDDL